MCVSSRVMLPVRRMPWIAELGLTVPDVASVWAADDYDSGIASMLLLSALQVSGCVSIRKLLGTGKPWCSG